MLVPLRVPDCTRGGKGAMLPFLSAKSVVSSFTTPSVEETNVPRCTANIYYHGHTELHAEEPTDYFHSAKFVHIVSLAEVEGQL